MEEIKIIEVKQSVFEDNNKDAEELRKKLKEEKTFLLNLMSSPGSGKTTTLKALAKELSGKKVQFLTGVNYHQGQRVTYADGYISVWAIHPADVSQNPIPIGAGMFYTAKAFAKVEKTEDMVRIISKPTAKITTKVVAASTKEAELNSAKRFEAYMSK